MNDLEFTAITAVILFVILFIAWKLFGKQLENNKLKEENADLRRELAKGKEVNHEKE